MTDATAAAEDQVTIEVTSIQFTECELLALDAVVRTEQTRIPLELFGLSQWAEDSAVLAAATRNGFSQMAIFGKVRLEEGNIVLHEDLGTLGTFMAEASRWIGVSLRRDGEATSPSIRWMCALDPGVASVGLEEMNFATWMIEPLPLPAEPAQGMQWMLGRAQKIARPGDTITAGIIDTASDEVGEPTVFEVAEQDLKVREATGAANQPPIAWAQSASAVASLLESGAANA